MRLTSETGDFLELAISGYEHPHSQGSNWLIVEGRARSKGSAWQFVHPCLEAGELVSLSEWLEALADGKPADLEWRHISFTEPNLGFEWQDPQGDRTPLLALLSAEARPPGDKSPSVTLRFELTTADLRAAVEQLRAEAARVPER